MGSRLRLIRLFEGSNASRPLWRIVAALVVTAVCGATYASPECGGEPESGPTVVFETSAGPLRIRLFPDAAPQAVSQFLELATGRFEAASDGGYYDSLTFDYTRPRVEIRTAQRSGPAVDFATQIDAGPLGLHERRLDSVAEAMAVVQKELVVAYRKTLRGAPLTPQLERWLERWYKGYEADFLVGTSRKHINEALGYAYEDGLNSRAVTRGSVALMPRSPRVASPRLSIALTDLPGRTGRWMVIGEVTAGLAVAERISLAPLTTPAHIKPANYHPLEPVAIESVRRVCADEDGSLTSRHGESK